MPRRRDAKPPRRPRVISTRLVLVSLVVGVVLAVVSVPVSVALMEWGPSQTSRLIDVELFVHEQSKAYYVRHVRPTSTLWMGFDGPGDHNPAWHERGMSPEAFAHQMGAALVPSSSLPGGAQAVLAGPADSVEFYSHGWPWLTAWGVRARPYQPANRSDVGLWQLSVFGVILTIPMFPLWSGLLGNTLFYAILVFAPVALAQDPSSREAWPVPGVRVRAGRGRDRVFGMRPSQARDAGMTSEPSWPPGLLALADSRDLHAEAPIAIGRVGNTIHRVRLRDGGWGVLKRGGGALGGDEAKADVLAEAERLAWLDGRAGAPRLLWAGKIGEHAASLATHLRGLPAHELQESPEHAITVAARALRAVHELPVNACPFGEHRDASDVVIHGDYALPNVVIDGAVVGIVDWSLMRIGDRGEDIDDAERSIGRNFGEDWVALFREAYGAVR